MNKNEIKKVLIVEDDKDLNNVLADGLKIANLSVFQALDGEQAMGLIVDKVPDLILLDLLLPKVDGFQVLTRLRSYPDPDISKIKVVVLSNLWSNKDILRAKALKIDGYYVKANTDVQSVFGTVHEILAKP